MLSEKISAESNIMITEHFDILQDGGVSHEEVQVTALVLDEIYWRMAKWLEYRPKDVVRVKIYSDAEKMNEETNLPTYIGGSFDRENKQIILQNPKKLREHGMFVQILVHEYTLLLLNEITQGNIPKWFSEGISILFSTEKYFPTKVKKVNTFQELETFLKISNLDKEDREFLYYVSRKIVYYLVKRHSFSDLKYILLYLRNGYSFEKAIEKTLKTKFSDFEEKSLEYMYRELRKLRSEFKYQ